MFEFLCTTFSISHRVVEVCMKKVGSCGIYFGIDGRSEIAFKKHNSTSEDCKTHVKSYIDSFPRIKCHYCRKDTKKHYLSPDLNLSVMYRDEYCKKKKYYPSF